MSKYRIYDEVTHRAYETDDLTRTLNAVFAATQGARGDVKSCARRDIWSGVADLGPGTLKEVSKVIADLVAKDARDEPYEDEEAYLGVKVSRL